MKRAFNFSRSVLSAGLALAFGSVSLAADDDAIAPEIGVSLRGVTGNTIELGEPLRIAVLVGLSEENAAVITLAPARGSWIDETKVELLSSSGDAVVAAARPVTRSAEPLAVVDRESTVNGLWLFPTDVLSSLTPGYYQVRARLVISDGLGWKGERASEPVRLCVVPVSSDPERVNQRILSLAHAAALDGALAKAASILDEELANNPDNVSMLKLRAALCLRGRGPASARVCINRARTLAARLGGEPSLELHELAIRIEEAANSLGPAVAAESWTRLPASVSAPLHLPATDFTTAPSAAAANANSPVSVAPAQPASDNTATAASLSAAPTRSHNSGAPSLGTVVPAAELTEASILTESLGQWAASATASSQYGKKQYSAAQAIGPPNINVAGNSPDAWSPVKQNDGTVWLEVAFAKPAYATEVRIRQNDTSGCISKVEAIDSDGTAHAWWEGVDPTVVPATREITWFGVRVPKTTYLVAKLKITLNLATVAGWKEVDAVQLVGSPE